MTPICRTSTTVQLWLIHIFILLGLEFWKMAYTLQNHKKHPVYHHEGTCNSMPPHLYEASGTTATHWLSQHFYFKYAFYGWTRQRIHNTLIVVDRYLWLMGDKMIPDSAEPRLESFNSSVDLLKPEFWLTNVGKRFTTFQVTPNVFSMRSDLNSNDS